MSTASVDEAVVRAGGGPTKAQVEPWVTLPS